MYKASFEPIEYDNDNENSSEDGARAIVSPVRRKLSYDNNLGKEKEEDDDDSYVEIMQKPTETNMNEFISKSLRVNKKNRRHSNVLPPVQFSKVDRKRSSDGKNKTNSSTSINDVVEYLSKKKADALNDNEWSPEEEKHYQDVFAIISPEDFDENGKFVGSGEKRRKVALALKKFNTESIQKIKKQTNTNTKKGKGLKKNFIPYSENIVYEYWDDPNELCERLKLLLSSKSAGNTNHDQEINSIIEELKERGIIV